MKIIHINAYKDYGSTGKLVSQLNNFCNESGIESSIAYSEGGVDAINYKIGNRAEKKIHALCSRITGLQGYYSTAGTRRFLKYLELEKPDIIHLHNLHSNYINIPMLLSYLGDKNIITFITLHDCWFYTDGCTHYTVDNCKVWIDESGKCTRLSKDIPSYFFDRSLKMLYDKKEAYSKIRNLHIIGVSDWITNESRRSIMSKSKSIRTIKNWVDEDIFSSEHGIETNMEKSDTNQKFTILGVASKWSQSKGILKFNEIAEYYGSSVKIVLVGNSEGVVRNESIDYIEEINSSEDLRSIYLSSDVLINFSLEESFGLVSAEALYNGIPVITNSSTANPEMIGKKCGIVLSDLKLNTIVDSISTIMINGKDYYHEHCVDFAQNNFNSLDNLTAYINSYREAIKNYE